MPADPTPGRRMPVRRDDTPPESLPEATLDEAMDMVVEATVDDGAPVMHVDIEKPPGIGESGFFDPERPGEQPEVILERLMDGEGEVFALGKPIGYWDAELGGFVVPADLSTFRTDLTSVPRYFTWLIPRTGRHLPAALVHDALIPHVGKPQSYVGPAVDRVMADRVFVSAMKDLDTPTTRRWLIWTAVAIATAWGSARWRWWWRTVILVTLGIIALIGVASTLDVFDCRSLVPWMGDRSLGEELLRGAAGALVIPAALSVLWWRRWKAGLIAGVALALLLHVTGLIVVVLSLYSAFENLIERQWRAAATSMLLALTVIGATMATISWACGTT